MTTICVTIPKKKTITTFTNVVHPLESEATIERNSSFIQIEMSVVSSDDDGYCYCYKKHLKHFHSPSRLFKKNFLFLSSLYIHSNIVQNTSVVGELREWEWKLNWQVGKWMFYQKAYMRVAWNSQKKIHDTKKQWVKSDNLLFSFFDMTTHEFLLVFSEGKSTHFFYVCNYVHTWALLKSQLKHILNHNFMVEWCFMIAPKLISLSSIPLISCAIRAEKSGSLEFILRCFMIITSFNYFKLLISMLIISRISNTKQAPTEASVADDWCVLIQSFYVGMASTF